MTFTSQETLSILFVSLKYLQQKLYFLLLSMTGLCNLDSQSFPFVYDLLRIRVCQLIKIKRYKNLPLDIRTGPKCILHSVS